MRNVQIQTTPVCNARCLMCPHHDSYLAQLTEPMKPEVFTAVLENIVGYQLGKICLYLQNEPFADPHLNARVDETIRTLKQFTHIELSTNCSLMSPDRLASLLSTVAGRKRLDVLLSLPGASKVEHQRITGLNFDTCLSNLRNFLVETDKLSWVTRQVQLCGVDGFPDTFFDDLKLVRKPVLSRFAPISRAGNVVRDSRPRRSPTGFDPNRCWRVRQWIHVNWRGEWIICCHDYHNEVVFGDLTKTDVSMIAAGIRNVLAMKSSSPAFICRRCETGG